MHRVGCKRYTLYALYTGHAVHRGHNTRRTRCPLYTLRTAHTGSAARCTQSTLCTLHPVNAVPSTRSTPVRLGPLKDDLWIWKPRKPPFWLPSKRRPLGGREKTWKTTFQKKDDLPKKKTTFGKSPSLPHPTLTGQDCGREGELSLGSRPPPAYLPTTSSFGNTGTHTYNRNTYIHTFLFLSPLSVVARKRRRRGPRQLCPGKP